MLAIKLFNNVADKQELVNTFGVFLTERPIESNKKILRHNDIRRF